MIADKASEKIVNISCLIWIMSYYAILVPTFSFKLPSFSLTLANCGFIMTSVLLLHSFLEMRKHVNLKNCNFRLLSDQNLLSENLFMIIQKQPFMSSLISICIHYKNKVHINNASDFDHGYINYLV